MARKRKVEVKFKVCLKEDFLEELEEEPAKIHTGFFHNVMANVIASIALSSVTGAAIWLYGIAGDVFRLLE